MLTTSKQKELLNTLKAYHKQYLQKLNPDLDESATRLMVNSFLTDVLGYTPIEDVKTEYMIRGAYADYVIKLREVRHFLVEVKSLGIELSEKHLRQARQYCADEGIDFALLTNGKNFEFYRIIPEQQKPIKISEKLLFNLDLSDSTQLKENMLTIQYLHKISVANKGLEHLWNKSIALDSKTVAGLLHNKPVLNFIKRALKKKYRQHFTDTEVMNSLNKVISEPIPLDIIKQMTVRKRKKHLTDHAATLQQVEKTLPPI
jgi:hypothetical protein